MDNNEKIASLIRVKGPIVPSQVSKAVNESLLMTSARLSELSSSKKVRISHLKVGGSPLYYLPGQEEQLQNYVENLNDKEHQAYSLLRDQKVLRDTATEPALRVALRAIKDFAIPLNVTVNNEQHLFWKWYLLPGEEASELIKTQFSPTQEQPAPKPETIIPEPQPPTIEQQTILEKPKEHQSIDTKPEQKQLPKEQQQTISKEPAPKKTKKQVTSNFLNTITNYCEKHRITIIDQEELKKNNEYGFVIELPTVLGKARYYCMAKSKKKINDADISSAIARAQSKNLPVLFLTEGELTKKTEENLQSMFNNVLFKKL